MPKGIMMLEQPVEAEFYLANLFPPSEAGSLMAIRSYYDASDRDGLLTLAGVGFGYDGAKKASKEWSSLFGGKECHMKDMRSRNGDFKGMSTEQIQPYIDGAIDIIARYAVTLVAVSFEKHAVEVILPTEASRKHAKKMREGFKNGYSYACHFAMLNLAAKVSGRIHYVFELGDDGQNSSRKCFEFIQSQRDSPLADGYRIGSLIYDNKCGDHPLLCAADMLAWEWGKGIKQRQKGGEFSQPLISILKGHEAISLPSGGYLIDAPRVSCTHYEGQEFLDNTAKLADLLASKTVEEVNAIRLSNFDPNH